MYDPHIEATNLSDVPVTVTSIELNAGGATLRNGPRAAKDYPVNLPPQGSAPLGAYFSLGDGAGKIFEKAGELRIHYSSQQGSGLARITVARGPANAR